MGKRRGNHEGSIIQLAGGRWQGRVSLPDGKRKAVYGQTQAECRKKLDSLKRRLDEGTFTDCDMTVKQYLTKWIEHRKLEVKPKTLSDDRYQCEKYIIPKLGKAKLTRLNVLQVQDMMKDLAAEVSPSCANRSRKILKNALGQALRWQLITRNPVDATKRLKEPKSQMVIWTYAEAARFLAAAKRTQWYPHFFLTMSTGMRISEMLGLRWQDVKGSAIHIRHTSVQVGNRLIFEETTKTDHSNRRITIPDEVVAALHEHKQQQQEHYGRYGLVPSLDLVFASSAATPLLPRNLERAYKALQAKAEVPAAKFHDLRHWHASMLLEEGSDIREIAKRLGHANPSITLRFYAHLIDKDKQGEVISLSAILPKVEDRPANYVN